MKKYLVNSAFIDRATGKHVPQGQPFGSDDGEQIARLQKRGVLSKDEFKEPVAASAAGEKSAAPAATKAAAK